MKTINQYISVTERISSIDDYITEKLVIGDNLESFDIFCFYDSFGDKLTVNLPFNIRISSKANNLYIIHQIVKIDKDKKDYIWNFYDDEKHILFSLNTYSLSNLFVKNKSIMPKIYLKSGIQNVKKSFYNFAYIELINPEEVIYNNNHVKENLNNINEKLVIGNNLESGSGYSDEELHNDYETVRCAYTKNEKVEIGDKYGVTDYRIRPIQLEILDRLRENRLVKNKFTEQDIFDFFRLEQPLIYSKFTKYLDNENKEFIEYMLEYYNNICKNINPARCSYADKDKLKIRKFLNQYLNK